MQLSQHFSLEEMTYTSHAIKNVPTPEQVQHLRLTCFGMEIVRSYLDAGALSVNSGFRNMAVNDAVGGSKTSDHMNGDACDFTCPKFGTPLEICHALDGSGILFDQLIQEGTWVHISFGPRMRQETLTKVIVAGETKYKEGLDNVA